MDWITQPLTRYFDIFGRSGRREYWLWVLFLFLLWLAFACAGFVLAAITLPGGLSSWERTLLSVLVWANWLAIAVLFIPSLTLTVRRLHDTDRSGWNVLWFWIPVGLLQIKPLRGGEELVLGQLLAIICFLVGSVVLLVFVCRKGSPEANRFGENPVELMPGEIFD